MTGQLSRESSKAGRLQRDLWDLLLEHQDADALPTNARFLFYELVQRGHVPKARYGPDGTPKGGGRKPSQDLNDALLVLREAGICPWSAIVDETRHVETYMYAATVDDYLADRVDEARIDCWAGGPPPLILCESRSLAGVLRGVAMEYLCPIASTNGQASGAFLANVIAPLFTGPGKGRGVVYLGDWDRSGHDIESSARSRLEDFTGYELDWGRLALTTDQVERFNLPVIMKRDGRDHQEREAVETESLSQTILLRLLTAFLDQLLPEPLADVHVREQQQRAETRRWLGGDA